MEKTVNYPIGQQDFKTLRERGALYVDKTHFIEKIENSGSQYYFLARPRRFGKSLFLSTLQYYFEGRRELFKGLYVDSLDRKWESFPVLRLDLNSDRYSETRMLEEVLDTLFNEWERKYDLTIDKDVASSQRFRRILEAVHRKTGSQVVILVDEYDKPLVGNLNDSGIFENYREKLASLYSNFKSAAEHIRLVFITGVSRFSKISVFSELNNLKDITFDDAYADICGITERELFDNFKSGIQKLADKEGWSYDYTCAELKRNYDGYRFARNGSDIYNTWSVLNAMDESAIEHYWTMTGIPTIIASALKRIDIRLEDILNTKCDAMTLRGLDLRNPYPLAMLYQTGYLTIKDYNRLTKLYTLGIPNLEIKEAFFTVLLPFYASLRAETVTATVQNIYNSIVEGKPEKMMINLQTFFASVPYEMNMEDENNFQNAFYILLSLIGVKAKPEVHTSDGRIDILIESTDYIYIIELKYDGTALDALDQIKEKRYARPYREDVRETYLIGVNFSSKTRTIEDWLIEAV